MSPPGDPAERFLGVEATTVSVSGDAFTQKIKERLKDCDALHDNCPKSGDTTLPTRVIYVGSVGSAEMPRLHVSEREEKGQYLALSYRWGGPQNTITTTSNLEALKSGFRIAILPKTLRDAIILTRELGFRYLWVDALCIIQNDVEDQSAEITKMGLIYKNATLTIAAANTPNADSSFLAERPLPNRHCTLPYLLPDGTFGTIYVKLHGGSLIGPLDSRAWALQESLLSPRLLYYSPGDLKWKCQTSTFENVHKTHNHEFRYEMSNTKRLPSSIFGISKEQPVENQEEKETQAVNWKEIVEDYSKRSLTIPEDRLPALAGIASELHGIWKDQYLAGMWRSLLLRQLAWWYDGGFAVDERLPVDADDKLIYQSPGWSWTSYKRHVRLGAVIDERAVVLQCEVILVDPKAPFSAVKEGKLVLRAVCLSQGAPVSKDNFMYRWDHGRYVDQKDIAVDVVYMFIGYDKKKSYEGLILEPAGGGTFRRIGAILGFSSRKDWPSEAEERVVTII